jgi:hypothetical protein
MLKEPILRRFNTVVKRLPNINPCFIRPCFKEQNAAGRPTKKSIRREIFDDLRIVVDVDAED